MHPFSRPSISLIAVLVAMFLVVRVWILFTAMPSFSTGDTDKWHDWAMEADHDRSPIAGAATRFVDYSFGECCGGHRFCLALCILSGAVVPPSYLAVKAWALLWGALTLVSFFWALRSIMSTTTCVLFALLFTFAPIRFLAQSHTLMGNHVESVLFMVTSLGFAIRAHRAAHAHTLKTRDVMIVGLTFSLGLAIYFLQSMWLWTACLIGTIALFPVTNGRWLDRGRVLAWSLVGFLPGALIIYKVYWPEYMFRLIPNNLYPQNSQGNDISRVFHIGGIVRLWSETFGSIADGLASIMASSSLWLVAGLFLLVHRRLRMALLPFVAFTLLMLAATMISGAYGARHLVACVPFVLLLQSLLLAEGLPWLSAKVAPKFPASRKSALVGVLGFLVGGVLLLPRIEDVAKVAGRHSIADAVDYDPYVLVGLGVDGMEVEYIRGAARVMGEIETLRQEMTLSANERAFLLEGVRLILGSGEHFNTERSLPESMVLDVSPRAMCKRSESAVDVALSRLEEQYPDDNPEDLEELFFCGFELGMDVLDPERAGHEQQLVALRGQRIP